MKTFLVSVIFLALSLNTIAHARIYIPIDQPSDKKFPISICDLRGAGKFGEEIAAVIRNDLTLSGYFNVLSPDIFHKQCESDGATINTISFSYWAGIEAQALTVGSIERSHGQLTIVLRLFDPYGPTLLTGKEYIAKNDTLREVAHRFSDEIMEALTGTRGVFNTKITYAAQTSKTNKEIFIMDMDGAGATKVTSLKSISISPSFSPQGETLVFSSYKNGGPNLYTIDVNGKELKQITSGSGAKITPIWSLDGSHIIFSSSVDGEADLYTILANGKNLKQLTSALGIDLSPCFSPDGSELVFASERAGNLHLFKMPANAEGSSTRLTYVGYQNDMPSWSPMADKIVFSGRDMGTFDIFIMNPDGSNIQRLTIASGSNEHPSFSPDGRFIVFSSTRAGAPAIYLMRADGSNQTRISEGNGVLPKWGPRRE